MDYEAVKYAALLAEEEGRYRDAYGHWKKMITHAEKNSKFKDPTSLVDWIQHMNYCQENMY